MKRIAVAVLAWPAGPAWRRATPGRFAGFSADGDRVSVGDPPADGGVTVRTVATATGKALSAVPAITSV